jgi:hypothetical protein
MDAMTAIMAIEEGLGGEERRAALQELIDTGLAWTLAGRVGREAADAIEDGRCVLGPLPTHDFWGNRIPSRYEVSPGTVGSITYANERGYEVAA